MPLTRPDGVAKALQTSNIKAQIKTGNRRVAKTEADSGAPTKMGSNGSQICVELQEFEKINRQTNILARKQIGADYAWPHRENF
jgi:hypothetical protein